MKRKIDIIALSILIAGAVNCGFIGIFEWNAVSWLFGGQIAVAMRIVYVIFAIAGLWCINLVVIQGQKRYAQKNAALDSIRASDPMSLKDVPENDTVCAPSFSGGCVNEETNL